MTDVVRCPSCGGRGSVPSAPYGEPDNCGACRGTGSVEPVDVLDFPESEWEPDDYPSKSDRGSASDSYGLFSE